MNRIGGVLDMTALARLHFTALGARQKDQAIHRMASSGLGANSIALATGLSVEFISQVLRRAERACDAVGAAL